MMLNEKFRPAVAFLVLWLGCLAALASTAAAQCSGERWPVKVGLDSDVSLVNLASATDTSITNLTSVSVPNRLPDTSRIAPAETTTWVIDATLVKYVRSYDGDYHMVFTDSSGRTMIGEIPDPGCVSQSSPFAAGIAHARAQFNAVYSAGTTFKTANVPVRITGVGFFDYNEGQEGYALNGIELHPIIDITFGNSFSLTASTSSIAIDQGASKSFSVTSTASNNFNSPVTFSVNGLPADANAAINPGTIAAPGSGTATFVITAGPATPLGTYNVVITGLGGGQSRSLTVNMTVTNGGQQLLENPGFEAGSANSAPWSSTSGVIDNSTYEAPHSGNWKAWLNGFGSVHTDTLSQQVSIPSSADVVALSFWRHIDTKETSTTKANDTLKVQIRNASGGVLATLATYSNLNSAAGYTLTQFDLSAFRGQTVQIYFLGVENSTLKTSFVIDDVALNVTASTSVPDFSISANPSALTAAAGSTAATTVSTSSTGDFNSSIMLSISGVPLGTTAALSPPSMASPGTGSATLTVTVGNSTPAGTYTIVVAGNGGAKSHSTSISLTVTSSAGTVTQLLGNAGFENGTSPAPWVVTSGVVDNTSYQPPHSGQWKAWLNGYGAVHTDTIYQQVTIPAAATSANLAFWRHIDTAETTTTAAYDTLKIQIRNSSGTVLANVAGFSNLDAAAGYVQLTYDLMAFRGQTIRIYVVGTEDSSLKTSFVVDDFSLVVNTP